MEEIVNIVLDAMYLAYVSGGATWSVWAQVSDQPVAVAIIAQGAAPMMTPKALLYQAGKRDELALRFVYHQQLAPQTVFNVVKSV